MHDAKPATNALVAGFVLVAGVGAGIFLIYSILTSRGNDLSEFSKYLALIGFVAGIVNPRLMLFPFLIATAYLDMLKRLLILYETPSYIDLFYVLGIAPMMLAGITLGTLAGAWFGKIKVERSHLMLLVLACLFIGITGVFAFRDHGPREAIKAVADNAAYSVLLFLIPVLLPSWDQLWRLLRTALIVYLPVGLYAFYQHFYGLTAFEVEYLKSGLTIMVKELDDIRPRPFSTLNSAHSLAFVSAMLGVIAFIPLAVGRGDPVAGKHRWRYAGLGCFYLTVCLLTMARSGHIVWIVALIALLAFSSRRRTALVYGTAVTVYLSLIIFADWFIAKLPVWDAHLSKETPLLVQATRIQTFTERLRSYQELKNWENYSFFGVNHPVFAHDAVTEALVHYGAIPLVIILGIGLFCLRRVHRWIFQLPTRWERRLASMLLGCGLGVVAGAVLFGGVAGVFPVNGFMWITFGGLVVVIFQRKEAATVSELPSQPMTPPSFHQPVPRPA